MLLGFLLLYLLLELRDILLYIGVCLLILTNLFDGLLPESTIQTFDENLKQTFI